MGKDKNKNITLLKRKINRDKELLKNLKKFGISERKITKLEEKITRREQKLTELQSS